MLSIKNLTCGYDSKFFLHNINFNVQKKEILGIIGPNGSGKTTLLRSLTRILKPKEGSIFLEDKDISYIGLKEFAKIVAIVSQASFTALMSVEEFVLMGRIPYYNKFQILETKTDFEIARKCMAQTGTLNLKDQLLTEISGGERQLVLIARALAQEPKLLLLDEPTTHLDITHQVEVLDLIKRLNKDFGLTVIMVLHDLNLASEYCHRLVLLNKGKVHKTGTPEEVINYKTIEEIYKTIVVTKRNPISSKPHIFIVPKEDAGEQNTNKR